VIPGSDHSNSDKSQGKIIAEIKRRLEKSHLRSLKKEIQSFVKNLVKPEQEFQNYDEQ